MMTKKRFAPSALIAAAVATAVLFSCSDMIADLREDPEPPSPPPDLPPIFEREVILHASDMGSGDLFGAAVAIDGDYAIVGAYNEGGGTGDPALLAGAAYIYERDAGGNWIEQAVLHASDMQAYDYFGCSVSISGNYAIVGAYYERGGAGDPLLNAGAAYIFERGAGGTWTERAILHASDMQDMDYFGYSVSISGEYAIVGAYHESGGAGDPLWIAGAAYVFERSAGGIWTQRAILHASDMHNNDYFGCAVAVSGSYTIIGACCEQGGSGDPATDAGAAYVFERGAGGTWTERAILHASDMQAGDYFGCSVAISGSDAIVGAPLEDGGSGDPLGDSGAAYFFARDAGGTWTQVKIVHALDARAGNEYGSSVAIDGDYAVVGAPREDGGIGSPPVCIGCVYIIERYSSGGWGQRAELHASNMHRDDLFGCSVGISGNYLIAGAYGEEGGSGNPFAGTGAAYIFEN